MEKDVARAGLRVPVKLNERLVRIANEMGVSKNALILQILWDWVDKQQSRAG